eukprot:scaffold294_cov221-Amphora_coffeaeformis.AAC.5
MASLVFVCTATVHKANPNAPLGLRLSASGDDVVVAHIAEDGLCAGTQLQVGMTIDSINGIPCERLAPQEVEFCLAEVVGTVSITTTRSPSSAIRMAPISEMSEENHNENDDPCVTSLEEEERPSEEPEFAASLVPTENGNNSTAKVRKNRPLSSQRSDRSLLVWLLAL